MLQYPYHEVNRLGSNQNHENSQSQSGFFLCFLGDLRGPVSSDAACLRFLLLVVTEVVDTSHPVCVATFILTVGVSLRAAVSWKEAKHSLEIMNTIIFIMCAFQVKYTILILLDTSI